MRIQESAENYLETILILRNKIGAVRSIDIVNELEYTKPSVSVAMKNLRENDYIVMDEDGYITLTESGLSIAESMYERHKLLTDCLIALGVDEKTAAEDSCRIEHVISQQTFEKIRDFANQALPTFSNGNMGSLGRGLESPAQEAVRSPLKNLQVETAR